MTAFKMSGYALRVAPWWHVEMVDAQTIKWYTMAINAMISAVSCAIQKRNGIIIHTTLQKILAAAPPPQVAIIIP